MQEPLSIDEMRQDLTERRDALRQELAEVDRALKGFDEAIATYWRLRTSRAATPNEQPEAPASSGTEEEAQQDKKSYTHYVYETIQFHRERGTFDPSSMTPLVNSRHGQNLTQDQVSIAMRNLDKSGKLVTVRKGGPRRPAVYALRGTPEAEQNLDDVQETRAGDSAEETTTPEGEREQVESAR